MIGQIRDDRKLRGGGGVSVPEPGALWLNDGL